MDAKYVKGMLNHPDIQPSAAVNRWIAAIQMFDFDLKHVPGKDFKGPDGLSRRRKSEEDLEDGEEAEEWVDEVLALGVWVDTWELGAKVVEVSRRQAYVNTLSNNGEGG